MSIISEFAEKQNAHNERIDNAVSGLSGDIDALKAKISELQNSPGQITPEDQAALNALESRASAMADKIAALDAMTEETPPVPVG